MINNFQQIIDYLTFNSPDDFYFLQIYKRKKDNPELKGDNKTIRDYYIYSKEQLEGLMSSIMTVCEENNARAYIRLNKRSSNAVALDTIAEITNSLRNGHAEKCFKAYPHAAGTSKTVGKKTWIVDIDEKETDYCIQVEDFILNLYREAGVERSIFLRIPTISGYHLIAEPFNSMKFSYQFPEITIHKDNPCLLFCNLK